MSCTIAEHTFFGLKNDVIVLKKKIKIKLKTQTLYHISVKISTLNNTNNLYNRFKTTLSKNILI